MSGRLEIELTSQRADGTWTWRAVGARLPKGEVGDELVPESAAVGSMLEAETSASLDGLVVNGLSVPEEHSEPENLLELIGSSRGKRPAVQLTSATSGSDRAPGRDSRGKRGRSGEHGRGARGKAGSGSRGRRHAARPRKSKHGRDGRAGRDSRRSERGRREDDARSRRRGGGRSRKGADEGMRPRHGEHRRRGRRQRRSGPPSGRKRRGPDSRNAPRQPRAPRLRPESAHRSAALRALPQEQRPLAREVMQGGIPRLRGTIKHLNQKAGSAGLPRIASEPLLVLAEKLAPGLKAAEWHDRADAALAGIELLDLRDIRSVVVASDHCARTAQARELAEKLKQGLAARIESDHSQWLNDMAIAINDGRTVRALKLSSRPPKAGSPLPPDIYERLTALAAAGLNERASRQRWEMVLQAVAFSPVRLHVNPEGLPERPGDDLLERVRRLAGQVPQIARLFGLETAGKRRRRPQRPPSSAAPPTPSPAGSGPGGGGEIRSPAPEEASSPAPAS